MKIEHNFHIDASPETVHAAVATMRGIRGWWSQNSAIAAAEGGTHHMHFAKGDRTVTMHFNVDTLVPGRRAAWTCTGNDNPVWINSTLVFETEAAGDGTAFKLVHDNFDEKWQEAPPYLATVEGWHPFMKSLKRYCEKGEGMPM